MPPSMACSVCRRPLNRHTFRYRGTDLELGWLHASPADHEPDPVPRDDVSQLQLVCDFCESPEIRWLYPADSFEMSRTMDSVNEWYACDVCHALVESDDWHALERRVLNAVGCAGSDRLAGAAALQQAWAGFRQHRKGPAHLMA